MAIAANRSGRRLEEFIADVLNERGYLFVPPIRFFPARELAQPIYTRQCEIGKEISTARNGASTRSCITRASIQSAW